MAKKVEATKEVGKFHPKEVREYTEKKFSVERMAKDYINVYRNIIKNS